LKILSTTLAALRATRRVEDRTSNRRQRKLATAENRRQLGTKRQLDDAGMVPSKHWIAHD